LVSVVFVSFKGNAFPLYLVGRLEEALVKVDSKGRIRIPQGFREELGDVVIFRKTRRGILLSPGETRDFMEEFRRVMLSEPRRTGIPENPSPKEMKAIWKEAN